METALKERPSPKELRSLELEEKMHSAWVSNTMQGRIQGLRESLMRLDRQMKNQEDRQPLKAEN